MLPHRYKLNWMVNLLVERTHISILLYQLQIVFICTNRKRVHLIWGVKTIKCIFHFIENSIIKFFSRQKVEMPVEKIWTLHSSLVCFLEKSLNIHYTTAVKFNEQTGRYHIVLCWCAFIAANCQAHSCAYFVCVYKYTKHRSTNKQ